MNTSTLKEILVGGNYVRESDFKEAISSVGDDINKVITHLIEKNFLTETLLTQAEAEYYKLPYYDLITYKPQEDAIRTLPEAFARTYHAVAVALDNTAKEVVIATDNVDKKDEIVEKATPVYPGIKIKVVYALKQKVDELFLSYKKTLDTRFAKIIKESKHIAPEILDQIIEDAFLLKASDIHFEPQEKDVLIRLRIDGLLNEVARIDKKYYENILNKIKVASSLRIDEHAVAQDGSMRFTKADEIADIRISILPTIFGEKVALRILSYYVGTFSLSELGLSDKNQKLLENASKKPFGMILIAGPTGSGKTTSLYALLKHINNPTLNITTIEDPVEYRIENINQIQVNEANGLDFANGLRSIVRQDPDVILVGEIRDKETVEISNNAALTGHLLFSTFHANDAITAIPRLIEMGAEPFLLSSTMEAIISQRLVRKICSACKYSAELSSPIMGLSNVYKGRGCNACNYTGYRGQIGIFEFLPTTDAIKNLIITNPDKQSLEKVAKQEGMKMMIDDGIEKVKQGLTTFEELARVIGIN